MFVHHALLMRPPAAGGGGGGLIGQGAPQGFFIPGAATSYAFGDVTGVTAGDLILVHLHPFADTLGADPAGASVTLGGVSLGSPIHHTAPTAANSLPCPAAFAAIAGATGDLALATALGFSARSCAAVVWIIGGAAASPIGQMFTPTAWGSNTSSLAIPAGGFTTGAAGNAYLASASVKGGDIAATGFADVDGYLSGKSGTNAFQDITVLYGWRTTPTAAAIAPVAQWTPGDRAAGLGTELIAA